MIGSPQGALSGHADVGFTSIPDLSSRGLRSSLLYDGIYAPIGEVYEAIAAGRRACEPDGD